MILLDTNALLWVHHDSTALGTQARAAIDAATRDSLELTCTSGGTRKGSLLDAVDRTVTGAGARAPSRYPAAPHGAERVRRGRARP